MNARWVCIMDACHLLFVFLMGEWRVSYTYRRGLRVARSTTMGNAKASERGTSNRYGLTSFYIMYL